LIWKGCDAKPFSVVAENEFLTSQKSNRFRLIFRAQESADFKSPSAAKFQGAVSASLLPEKLKRALACFSILTTTSRLEHLEFPNVQIYTDDWETMLFRLILLLYGPWISVLTQVSALLDRETNLTSFVDASATTARKLQPSNPDRWSPWKADIFMMSLSHVRSILLLFLDRLYPPTANTEHSVHPSYPLSDQGQKLHQSSSTSQGKMRMNSFVDIQVSIYRSNSFLNILFISLFFPPVFEPCHSLPWFQLRPLSGIN
jgi:hypothetical protein